MYSRCWFYFRIGLTCFWFLLFLLSGQVVLEALCVCVCLLYDKLWIDEGVCVGEGGGGAL